MPVKTTITIYPDQPASRDPAEKSAIIQAGKAHQLRSDSEWSFLEALTWIATRRREVVNGVAPYHIEVAPIARQLSPNEPIPVEYMVASMVADTIAQAFCQCDRKVDCPLSVAEWKALPETEQAAAASDAGAKRRLLCIRAHSHICTCFDAAAQALFTAAATGKLTATAGPQSEPISRLEWQQADYDLMEGLRLGARRPELVRFRPSAILQLWPASTDQGTPPKGKGRPSANLKPVADAFQQRRDQGNPLEASQLREWARCIELAASNGHTYLPKPETCRRHLGVLYKAEDGKKQE